jgi:HAD superfamily hydrolase (TIGR01509 family)
MAMVLDIPPGDFAGYIFDLDGTLIDSMPLHYRAWDAALRKFGLREPLDENLFYSLGGVPTHRVAELLAGHYGLTLDPVKVTDAKEAIYRQGLPGVRLIEPVVAFARKVAADHPVAIATGGTPDVARPALTAAGLEKLFRIVITPHDVPPGRGKPAPDMFLLAAERMGVPPGRCLVFEDAEPGIAGARAAGMSVVRVDSRESGAPV